MAAIGTIKLSDILDLTNPVITDSATIGVSHTFDPEGFVQPGVTRWVDRSGGIAMGYPALTMSVRPPTKASRIYKVTAKVVLPVMETLTASTASGITPAPTKAYDLTFIGEFMLPERSALAERKQLLRLAASLFFDTINASDAVPTDATGSPLKTAVEDFERPY